MTRPRGGLRLGQLQDVNGWSTGVLIVGETPKMFRIMPVRDPLPLKGRRSFGSLHRWINPGETTLVPKSSVMVLRVRSDKERVGDSR